MENPLVNVISAKEAEQFIKDHGACRVYWFSESGRLGHLATLDMFLEGAERPWQVMRVEDGELRRAQAHYPANHGYIIPTYVFSNGLREASDDTHEDWTGLQAQFWARGYRPSNKPQRATLAAYHGNGQWIVSIEIRAPWNENEMIIDQVLGQSRNPIKKGYLYPEEYPPQTPSESSARQLGKIFLGGR